MAAATAARAPALKVARAQERYGADGVHRVLALEARLQARFDRFTEEHRPVLWPNMPIHM